MALLRSMAAEAGICEVRQQQDSLLLMQNTLHMEGGRRLTLGMPGRVLISAGKKPYFQVKIKPGLTQLDTLREALEILCAPPEGDSNDASSRPV